MDEKKKSEMKRVYTTVVEMMNGRGYIQPNLMTPEQFIEYHDSVSKPDVWFRNRQNLTDKILVSFTKVLSSTTVKETKSQMERDGVYTVIFVVRDKSTNIAKVLCENSVKVHFEIFKEEELLVNVTKHKMVPAHQLITEDEKKALLEKYTLKESELPRIQVTDPMARYYGLRRGQVVKITRRSESAGKYVTYRLTV